MLEYINDPNDIKRIQPEDYKLLAKDIRRFLLKNVSRTGGHLASNLGIVELTMALHLVLDFPKDQLIFDVGHQSYVHKILTGRKDGFQNLRQFHGMSGFPKRKESNCDAFHSGHSSMSLSAALGMVTARDINHTDETIVAVIGDGALSGGMAYEALNNAAELKTNFIIIINDNNMSISKNVGSVAKYLANIRNSENYVKTKKAVERKLQKTPVIGAPVAKMIKSSKDALRDTVFRSATIFEDFGFVYLGPVDGHNLEDLEEVLQAAKAYECPVFVHIHTKKGKGYLPSEKNPGEFHGISRFNVETGNPEISGKDTYSDIFGKELVRLAKKDASICAITAAMEHGTGLQYFSRAYPQRYYDVGIAEQHAVTFAAALASQGKLPVFAVYSSFLQRAYDQLLHDVAIGKLHVVLGIDRAGVVGEDGETHHGLFDVSFLTSIPSTTIYAPACYDELTLCLRQAMYQDTGLACVRYPRGADNTIFDKSALNTAYTHTAGCRTDTLLIGYGRTYDLLYRAKQAAEKEGFSCDLLKLTQIFPLPELVPSICRSYQRILFFEEAYYYGGISQLLGDLLLEMGYTGSYQRIAPKQFIPQASIAAQLDEIGLSEASMLKKIRQTVKQKEKEQSV